MDHGLDTLKWSTQLSVAKPTTKTSRLHGDKIILPPTALEQLLAAAPITSVQNANRTAFTPGFDPYNPHSFTAERQAREQLSDRQQQLPHPLTFRVVNPNNGRVVHAGIREFSAEENEVGLSSFLREALGLDDESKAASNERPAKLSHEAIVIDDDTDNEVISPTQLPNVTIHAKQLPKGTYVRLRPLEAGYNPEDWKALLERHLRDNFTTLTNGELLTVPGGRNEHFRFLVDKFLPPETDGICIVDTDLEVDIEPLNEEQARESLKKILANSQRAPGTKEGGSPGGKLDLGRAQNGQVFRGEYVDYEIRDWDRTKGLEIEVEADDEAEIDLFLSPFSATQRSRPRNDEYVFGDISSRPSKRIKLQPTVVDIEQAESLYISVHAYVENDSALNKSEAPLPYKLIAASQADNPTVSGDLGESHDLNEVQCKNCLQWVPQQRLFLHENFCLRNNVLCPHCQNVFQKRSVQWASHWHCPDHPTAYGNNALSKLKHDNLFHSSHSCASCDATFGNLPALASHRTTVCPGKLILCQFCHLLVPQQGEGDPELHDPEVLLSGLTPHELADGARTTECHICSNIVRLRDMKTHLRHHDLERRSRPKPRICRNINCGRTVDGILWRTGLPRQPEPGNDNDLHLCQSCFGPLYVAMYDPEAKALKRRVERRLLQQVLTGCGKPWCRNETCKIGRKHLGLSDVAGTKDAMAMIKPMVAGAVGNIVPLGFCVDESSQKRRILAEMLAAGGVENSGYDLEWAVAAMEAEGGDVGRAGEWLKTRAPFKGETMR